MDDWRDITWKFPADGEIVWTRHYRKLNDGQYHEFQVMKLVRRQGRWQHPEPSFLSIDIPTQWKVVR